MAKFFKTSLILLALAVAACNAEAPRYRQRNVKTLSRQRVFARQEAAAPTPYPSAAELKPEVPFEAADIAAAGEPDLTYGPPEQTYGPPDQTYGPPEVEQLPSDAAPEDFAPNPDAEEFLPAEEQDAAAPAPEAPEAEAPLPARLTQRRRRVQKLGKLQQQPKRKLVTVQKQQKQQRLVAAPAVAAVPVPAPIAATPFATQQYYVVNQPFAYTAQFQSW